MSHELRPIACLVLWVLIPAVFAGGAAAQEEAPPVFVETVDVDVINVEVFVTDRSGQPVIGLEAEDFEIFEDGKPVEVTNFFTTSRSDRVAASLDRELDELAEEGLARPAEMEPLPEDQRLHLAVYVDHFNLRPEHRRRVLEDLERFVEDRLIQGDRIMLAGYTRQIEVVTPFTQDLGRLLEGLKGMRKVASHRPIADAERVRVMRQMRLSEDLETSYQMLRSYVQSARSDLRHSAKALPVTRCVPWQACRAERLCSTCPAGCLSARAKSSISTCLTSMASPPSSRRKT